MYVLGSRAAETSEVLAEAPKMRLQKLAETTESDDADSKGLSGSAHSRH